MKDIRRDVARLVEEHLEEILDRTMEAIVQEVPAVARQTDDVKALTEFAYMWSDLMQLDIAPIVEDAELGEVFGRALK